VLLRRREHAIGGRINQFTVETLRGQVNVLLRDPEFFNRTHTIVYSLKSCGTVAAILHNPKALVMVECIAAVVKELGRNATLPIGD